jgi:TP901 family phage tail tape measure protein
MTREIEARLKLSAVDRTASAFKSVTGRMAAMDARAKAVNAASAAAATRARIEAKAATVAATAGRAELAATAAAVKGYLAPVGGVLGASASFKNFAAFDRKMTDIGVTADATKEQISGAARAVREISQASAMPLDQTVEGLDSLVAAGRDLPEAMAFLPSVVRTARAASAEVIDIAKSADAMGESFKIAAGDMEKAFDIADYLGKRGKFELKDQARYLPSIAPLAATRGLLGLDGLARVGAASQVIRKNAGTAEEAAASISDVLGKLDADETIKRMKKEFGVDLPKALAKARKEGRNTFDAFLDITELAIKGDFEKINRIFGDKEARRGLTALMMYRDEYRKLIADARNAAGTVATDHAKKVGDAQAAVDRLSNSASHAAASVGKLLDTMGGSTALETFAKLADVDADKLERITTAAKGGKPGEMAGAAFGDRLGYLDAAAKIIGYYIDKKSPAQRYREDLAAAASEDTRRLAKAREEVARIDKIRSRYGSEPLPAVLQAQYDAARRVVDAPRNLGARFPSAIDRASVYTAAEDAASEIHRQRARMGLGRADLFALPTPRPLDIPTKFDDREIESEMQRMRARLQSSLDANPLVVRTRVDPVRAPLDTGRSFKGGDFTGAP